MYQALKPYSSPSNKQPGSSTQLLCRTSQDPLLAGLKLDADAVHTVALVSGCREALSLEHVAQVSSTVGAGDLYTHHAKGAVLMPIDCTFLVVKEGWPAAT